MAGLLEWLLRPKRRTPRAIDEPRRRPLTQRIDPSVIDGSSVKASPSPASAASSAGATAAAAGGAFVLGMEAGAMAREASTTPGRDPERDDAAPSDTDAAGDGSGTPSSDATPSAPADGNAPDGGDGEGGDDGGGDGGGDGGD